MSPECSRLVIAQRQLKRNGSVDIPSKGCSMFPAIRSGDVCRFVPIDGERLMMGEIVLFADDGGQLVGHRLVRITGSPRNRRFVCKGDTNRYPDEPIARERIIGKLTHVQRSNKAGRTRIIAANGSLFAAWGTIMFKFPQLSIWLRKIALTTFA